MNKSAKTQESGSADKSPTSPQPISTRTTQEWYEVNANLITEEFEKLEFKDIHSDFLNFLSQQPCSILEIGSGTGRDAAWLADLGHQVIAAEPSDAMRTRAQTLYKHNNIRWVDDKLPNLDTVIQDVDQFDVIFLSAVWMHLAPSERSPSLKRIVKLVKPGGLVYITLRHGPFEEIEGFWDIADDEVMELARKFGLVQLKLVIQEDHLDRPDVTWSRMIFRFPNDHGDAG